MESLEKIFSRNDYAQLVEQIKERKFFKFHIKGKKLEFRFSFEECNNGCWKDNLMCSYGASYKDSGFGYPFQYDQIPSYEEICESVNKMIKWEEQND